MLTALIGFAGVIAGAALASWFESRRTKESARRDALTVARVLQADAEFAARRLQLYLSGQAEPHSISEFSDLEQAWRSGGEEKMARFLEGEDWATVREAFSSLHSFTLTGGGERSAVETLITDLQAAGEALFEFWISDVNPSVGGLALKRRATSVAVAVLIAGLVLVGFLTERADKIDLDWTLGGLAIGAGAALLTVEFLGRRNK